LIWKFFNSPPTNKNLPKLHFFISSIVHNLLYFLVILTTIQGTLMSQVGGFDVNLLSLITLPRIIGENLDMYPIFKKIHYTFWIFLLATFTVHFIGEIYHLLSGDKYGIWQRMNFWTNKK